MMKIKTVLHSVAIALMALTLWSCYEDKGNYVYDESIHDISVSLPSSFVVKLQKNKFTYTITPTVKTVDGDSASLQYVWMRVNESLGYMDTVATTKSLAFEIDPSSKDFSYEYKFRLYVTDPKTQGLTMVPTSLTLAKPYTKSWLVLHEVNGHAELGSVDYSSGQMLVTPNAYSSDQGKSLTGKPYWLGVAKDYIQSNTYWYYPSKMTSEIYLGTSNAAECGLVDQVQYLTVLLPWQYLLVSSQMADLDLSSTQTSAGAAGVLLASKGKAFRNCDYSPCFFELNPSAQFEGDYYITKVVAGPSCGLAYDSIGHRFALLNYGYSNWYGVPQTSVKSAGEISPISTTTSTGANPNAIPEDEQVISLMNGYRYSLANPGAWLKYSAYAYALCPDGKSKVYVFHYRPLINVTSDGDNALSAVYQFATPQGLTASTPMCSSYVYNNIIFYAVGNTIYKLDFATGKTTAVYTCEGSSVRITKLRMAVEGYLEANTGFDNYSSYGHPYTQCLGAAVETADGQGEIVVLQLNNAGNIDSDKTYPSVQVHKGFGKIADFDFI